MCTDITQYYTDTVYTYTTQTDRQTDKDMQVYKYTCARDTHTPHTYNKSTHSQIQILITLLHMLVNLHIVGGRHFSLHKTAQQLQEGQVEETHSWTLSV